MLNHMRHVDELVCLRFVGQKTPNIDPDFGQLYGVRRPRFYVGFAFYAKLGTKKVRVSQPKTSCQEPAFTKAHIEYGGMVVFGQKTAQFMCGLQDSGGILCFGPGRGTLLSAIRDLMRR